MSEPKPLQPGTEILDAITKHLDRRFIGAVDLLGQPDREVTIDRVDHYENLKFENGQTENNALVMFFKGTAKGLLLKSKNIQRLIMALGTNNCADWKGRKIKLGIEEDRRPDLGGQKGPCVRVKMNR